MTRGFAAYIKPIRIAPTSRITVGCSQKEKYFLSLRQGGSGNFDGSNTLPDQLLWSNWYRAVEWLLLAGKSRWWTIPPVPKLTARLFGRAPCASLLVLRLRFDLKVEFFRRLIKILEKRRTQPPLYAVNM